MFSGDHQEDNRLHVARVAGLLRVAKTAYVTTLAAGALLVAVVWGPLTRSMR